MSLNQLLVSSFQDLAGEIPSGVVGAFLEHHLNPELRHIFEDSDLPDFCKFLLDNLKTPAPFAGLALALKNLNDDLSLHSGQFLPESEIEAILLQFNVLCKSETGELLTAEGSAQALVHFGKSSFLLYGGKIITGFEDQRFSSCHSVESNSEGLFSGVFQFNEELLPVISSKIITAIGPKQIDCFYGRVLEEECFGCIRSGEDFYIVDRGEIKNKLNFIVEKCEVCLDLEGLMQAIIYGLTLEDQEPIHYAIVNGKLQKGMGGSEPENVKSLWADPKSGNIYSMVVNTKIPGKRLGEILDDDGVLQTAELDYLLPMINGQVIDNINYKPIDYILQVGFFEEQIFGKVISAGQQSFALGNSIQQKIRHSKITEFNFSNDFIRSGNATLTLEDGRCVQLYHGEIVRSIEEQTVIDYRPINIASDQLMTGPTGFFKFKLGWMLVVNGVIDQDLAELGSLQLDTWEYQADLSPNLKLSFSGVAFSQENAHSAHNFIDLLVIDGQKYTSIKDEMNVSQRLLGYAKMNFLNSGEAICQVMLGDGTFVYYENESFYSPKDFFLLSTTCLAKEQFNVYLNQFDYFVDPSALNITALDNVRIGYDGKCFCSFNINDVPYLLLGGVLLQQNSSIQDLELNVETAGKMYLSFTRDLTIESYGYEHF